MAYPCEDEHRCEILHSERRHVLMRYDYCLLNSSTKQTEMALRLNEWSKTLTGMQAYCVKAYAEALEVSNHTHVFVLLCTVLATLTVHTDGVHQ
jgi:hypothetical protein